MENDIMKYVFSQSMPMGLFLWLFWYTLKRNDEREKKFEEREEEYRKIIADITNNFKIVSAISDKVDNIESILKEGKRV